MEVSLIKLGNYYVVVVSNKEELKKQLLLGKYIEDCKEDLVRFIPF